MYQLYTDIQLRTLLRSRNLRVGGKKQDLIDRLISNDLDESSYEEDFRKYGYKYELSKAMYESDVSKFTKTFRSFSKFWKRTVEPETYTLLHYLPLTNGHLCEIPTAIEVSNSVSEYTPVADAHIVVLTFVDYYHL